MTEAQFEGGCFCGAVRYRVTATPAFVGICYCDDCTRAVGSSVTVWADFPTDRFEFTRGEPTRFESSPGVTRSFCGRCGTSLTYHYKDGKKVDVSTASLDDPARFPATTEGPEGARPAWLSRLGQGRQGRDEDAAP